MENTRFIMLEGLPGTGKSTNSYFLSVQLERSGLPVKWIHEVAHPHPFTVFNEAIFTFEEYHSFLNKYPRLKPILSETAVFRNSTVGIDLFALAWNDRDAIGDAAFEELQHYDGWNFPLHKYMNAAFDKWNDWAEKALENESVIYLLDSNIFQYQIFTFLLKNAPYEQIERFVCRLIEILKPFHPSLIYFYRENPADTITFLEKIRGSQFLESIWERDRMQPYYRDKPAGALGQKRFLLDYADIAGRLFDAADCRKKAIEITRQDWKAYEREMLSFFNVEYKPNPEILPPDGVFRNEILDLQIEVSGSFIRDPHGTVRPLTAKSDTEFYVDCLPVILCFHDEDEIVMGGEQICERWTARGTRFRKTSG